MSPADGADRPALAETIGALAVPACRAVGAAGCCLGTCAPAAGSAR